MKKLLTILAVAAALAAVSCTKEREMNGDNGPMASVSFTVNSAELMTKADYGQATAINQLLVQVFNQVGTEFEKLESPEVTITPNGGTPASWKVDMKLAKNETYKIAFWAQKSGNVIYGTDDLSAVTVDYSEVAINNDDADAFCAARLVTVSGSLSQTVLLYRPLAQINIGTNDLDAYKKSVPTAKKNLTATITLPVETPNKLNVIGGTESEGVVKSAVTGTTTEEVVFTTAPDYVMSGKDITSSSVSYDYLTMLYVLAAPDKETMTFKAKLNNGTTDVSDLTVSNMPYQANYRTNIVGQLLTGSFEYNVEIEEGFYADYEKLVSPTFASLAELNTYLAGLKENTSDGDHGDINPEQVTLTALGTVSGTPQIILPKIHGGVDIRLAFEYDGPVEIVYADPADGAKKPANIFFYAQKLNTLEATVPQSHFELLSGSIVTNKAIVSTNTTTFVIQNGAKVGTAEIQKGNATIAGTVETVSVPTGAKADDDNNPVKVFLNKVSAVNEIVLNAKTDVVVEQPKDQIDVVATEKKVAVYVNEGAENSTAKAQNGGVIYVEANVPCTVTADGTSTAEEGNVSSTVIINENANGSAVVATNGASVDLKANANCAASAEGTAEGQGTSSTITITEAEEGVKVNTSTNDNGVINNTSGEDVVVTYAAKIGDTIYETLQAAFAAVSDDVETTIVLQNRYVIIGNDGIAISSKKNIILDLNGWLLSNAVNENRASQIFNIQGGTLTVRDSKGNGEIYNDVQKGTAPGEWWPDQHNSPYNYATNVINNCGTFILESGTIRQTAKGSICYALDNNSGSYDAETILRGGVMTSNGTTMRMFCNSVSKKNQLTIPANSTALLEGNYTSLWIQLPGSSASSMKKASLDIKGGTLKGNTYAFYDYSFGDGWDNVEYNITGGKFIGGIWSYKGYNTENPYKFLTGGTFSQNPQNYVADGYVSYFDDAAQVWKIKLEDVAQVGNVMYTSLVDAFEAAQAGDEVKMVKNMYIEATVTAPYGNKCGIKQNGEILNGQDYNLYLTTGGDQYTIMTSGGTIKNLTIASGFRAIMLMYPQTDVYIDNVTSGPNVCYAINTGEQGNHDARIIATNSTFLGWCSFSLIASASFTNCKFGQGTYYTNIMGRLIKPYVTTTFTDCEFGYNCAEGDKYYLDLSAFQAGQTIKMINCKVGDTVITAANVADLLDGWDESNNNYSFDKSIFEIIQFANN